MARRDVQRLPQVLQGAEGRAGPSCQSMGLKIMPYADRKAGEQARAARRAAAGLCRNCPAKAIPSESQMPDLQG